MKKARAAEIWAALEKRLIERCGLPNGRMLDVERPNLIRRIGSALTGRAAAVTNVSPPLPPRTAIVERVSAMAGRDINGNILPPPPDLEIDRTAKSWWRSQADTIHDAKLAAMLEQSCSRRMGYDGDDTVHYE